MVRQADSRSRVSHPNHFDYRFDYPRHCRASDRQRRESESDISAPYTSRNAELPRIHDLLSRDIPLILRQHCSDFRQAQSKAGSAWAPLGTPSSSIPSGVASQSEQDEYRRQRVHEQLSVEHQQVLASSTDAAALPPPLTLPGISSLHLLIPALIPRQVHWTERSTQPTFVLPHSIFSRRCCPLMSTHRIRKSSSSAMCS